VDKRQGCKPEACQLFNSRGITGRALPVLSAAKLLPELCFNMCCVGNNSFLSCKTSLLIPAGGKGRALGRQSLHGQLFPHCWALPCEHMMLFVFPGMWGNVGSSLAAGRELVGQLPSGAANVPLRPSFGISWDA